MQNDYLVVIPCGKKKVTYKAKAKDMYIGSYFKLIYNTVSKLFPADYIYILSAKYGLLKLEKYIEPYEVTFNHMSKLQKDEYKKKLNEYLSKHFNKEIQIISFLPKKYKEFINNYFINIIDVFENTNGMGQQKQLMKQLEKENNNESM